MKAELLQKLESIDQPMRDVFLLMLEEVSDQSKLITIGRADFEELKGVVRAIAGSVETLAEAQIRTEKRVEELGEAQLRTEKRLDTLVLRVDDLTQAQARTEKRMDELAQAQARTEQRMDELAHAQARTEKRMDELAHAQARTEKRMDELAHAQARTEMSVRKLADKMVDVRKQLGGLAMDIGYGIEDRLMPRIPAFSDRVLGIKAELVDRRNILYPDGSHDEANIYVEGQQNGQSVTLIGECKAQPGKRDFDRFAGMLGRIRQARAGDVLGIMIGYHYAPEVEAYARANHPAIRFFKTFEVERG